jgi:membrane protein YqaA with SNARE-associated domain
VLFLSLFFASLLAATLLPGGSEALLLYDLSQNHSVFLLFLSATAGNTLGSIINYLLGYKGSDFLLERGYLKPVALQRGHAIFEKWGAIALLLSWMPVVGDPVTFAAGVLRYEMWKFLILVLIAKGVRYAVIIALYLQFR